MKSGMGRVLGANTGLTITWISKIGKQVNLHISASEDTCWGQRRKPQVDFVQNFDRLTQCGSATHVSAVHRALHCKFFIHSLNLQRRLHTVTFLQVCCEEALQPSFSWRITCCLEMGSACGD